jgi:hypothetical protein
MKRALHLVLVLVLAVSAWARYNISDLPSGWDIDPNQIQGQILPAVPTDPNLPRPDPNDLTTWLVPIGRYERIAPTNKWVARVAWIATSTSDSVSTHADPNTGPTIEWRLIGWSPPGPWYKVVEVISWRGASGQTKSKRYTIVGVGIIPDHAEPELY